MYVGRFWFWRQNASVEMIRAGFATIYENSGAEYGNYESLLRKYEKEAKYVFIMGLAMALIS